MWPQILPIAHHFFLTMRDNKVVTCSTLGICGISGAEARVLLGAGIRGKLEPFFIRIIVSSTISSGPMTSFERKVHQFPVDVKTNHYRKNS